MTCTSHSGPCTPVVLIDGTTVCTHSTAFRHECEARWLLEGRNLRQRREYLSEIGAKRGADARARLERTITAMWAERKAA